MHATLPGQANKQHKKTNKIYKPKYWEEFKRLPPIIIIELYSSLFIEHVNIA